MLHAAHWKTNNPTLLKLHSVGANVGSTVAWGEETRALHHSLLIFVTLSTELVIFVQFDTLQLTCIFHQSLLNLEI